MKTAVTWMLVICLVPYLTGCEELAGNTLTGRLWDSASGPFNHGPATPPNLNLYQDPQHGDILVQYDELNDQNGAITRRVYLLDANQDRIRASQKPHFVTIKATDRLEPVPVETNPAALMDSTSNLTLHAVVSPDGHEFTLFSNGQIIGPCHLPVYGGVNHFDRVMLTPVTVVGDVVIYSAIAAAIGGVVFLLCWASSQESH